MAKWSNYYTAAEILLSKSSHWLRVCNSTELWRESLCWPEASVLAKVQSKCLSMPQMSSPGTHRKAAQMISSLIPPSPSTWWLPNTSPRIFPCVRAAGAIAEPLTKQQPASLRADSCVKVPEKLQCFPQSHFRWRRGVVIVLSWWDGACWYCCAQLGIPGSRWGKTRIQPPEMNNYTPISESRSGLFASLYQQAELLVLCFTDWRCAQPQSATDYRILAFWSAGYFWLRLLPHRWPRAASKVPWTL